MTRLSRRTMFIGIGNMFQHWIRQFLNLFTNTELEVDEVPEDTCRSDELNKIKDQVTSSMPSNLKVLTIVGMGGIGKTTLAKSIYDDVEISHHFHLRAWTSISQDYKFRNVLLDLLRSFVSLDKVSQLDTEDIAYVLSRKLRGHRFLIVLDDIWNVEIWKDFKWIFPNDNNGSRVILTTRLMEVASHVEPDSPPHRLDYLSNEESWMLLHTQVFAGKACPSDLVEIGKEIAKKCQGLPLAIVVVAGHLSKIDKKQDCWADVAKRLDVLLIGTEGQILDILCLSYNYLPLHLKACFLYMGIFPKNSGMHALKLIRMWSAVGFLRSEDEAEKCLEDLINRNLITVRKEKYDGTANTCGIHDLLWDLSLREARREGHYIFSQFNPGYPQFDSTTDDENYLFDLTSSYLFSGKGFEIDFPYTSICFRLLRVLDIQSEYFYDFPETITNLVGLRYLELRTYHISGSVSKLCNLETFINRLIRHKDLPTETWLLRHLRHLQVGKVTLEIPISCNNHLQTLSKVRFDSCTHLVISRIPNLKQLKICDIDGEDDGNLSNLLKNLVCLCRLEKLNLHFSRGVRRQQQVSLCEFFPHSVKQLTLSGSRLEWEVMNVLAKLPNIEVLKLKNHAFEGPIYEQTVEGFPRLKVLLFESLGLEQWIAETTDYSILQHLVLRDCSFLKEIPCCFGLVTTLKSIKVDLCSFLEESAKTIQQEQQSMGNYDLQVRLNLSSSESELVDSRADRFIAAFYEEMFIAKRTEDSIGRHA